VASSSASGKPQFAAVLQSATSGQTGKPAAAMTPGRVTRPMTAPTYHAAMMVAGGPTPLSRAEILNTAQQLMNVPYVWGGNSSSGLDCSAFVSKAWGISRHTTDNLSNVAEPISKEELEAGDALNLTTSKDADGAGHVRLFDRWANAEHTKMYVYEETPPRSIHHVINWDPSYQPMRRFNVTDA
jgi:cell wall-associated NlpC family hydrolase